MLTSKQVAEPTTIANKFVSETKDQSPPQKQTKSNDLKTFSKLGITDYGMAHFQLDDASPNCSVCETTFGFFTRRHHCRGCRLLVCDGCSQQSVRIGSKKKSTKVRMCERCVFVLKLPVEFKEEQQQKKESVETTTEVDDQEVEGLDNSTLEIVLPESTQLLIQNNTTPSTPPTPSQTTPESQLMLNNDLNAATTTNVTQQLRLPQTPNTLRRNKQQDEASHELVDALRQIELLEASLESRENFDHQEELHQAIARSEQHEQAFKTMQQEHATVLLDMQQEMNVLRRELQNKTESISTTTSSTTSIPPNTVVKDLLKKHSIELNSTKTSNLQVIEKLSKTYEKEMNALRQNGERQTMIIMDKHSALLEQLRVTTLELEQEKQIRTEIESKVENDIQKTQEKEKEKEIELQKVKQQQKEQEEKEHEKEKQHQQQLQLVQEEHILQVENIQQLHQETMIKLRADSKKEMLAYKTEADTKRIRDLEAGRYSKQKSEHRVYGNTVDFNFYDSFLLQTCFIVSLSRFVFYSKTPKTIFFFFNVYQYI